MRDARIKLEGRLETVEHAVMALEGATHAPADFTRLALAIDQMSSEETREAERQVMRLARADPALQPLVDASWSAKHRAAELVFARAKRLGMPQASVLDTACALAAERPRCELTVRNPGITVQLCMMGMLALFAAISSRSLVPALIYGLPMLIASVMHFVSAVPVIVTGQRFVVGREVFPLEHIERVELYRRCRRSFRPYCLMVQLRDGGERELRLPWVPDEMVGALRHVGVEVRPHLWPWS